MTISVQVTYVLLRVPGGAWGTLPIDEARASMGFTGHPAGYGAIH
jgi:hypothetical protein